MCYLMAMYKWPWSTIWTAVQAIGVPFGIWVAIYGPKWHARSNALSEMIAFRNIAHYTARFLPVVASTNFDAATQSRIHVTTLETCLRILKTIPLERISPAYLSEDFAIIDVEASRIIIFCQTPAPHRRQDDMKTSADIAQAALLRVDAYLIGKGARYGPNNTLILPD